MGREAGRRETARRRRPAEPISRAAADAASYHDPDQELEAMTMFHIDNDLFFGVMVFSIPILAIVGGITAGIVRTLGQQRLAELAARERLAAIERGIDPAKLPPPPTLPGDGSWASHDPNHRAQSLMIGGLVTLAVGIGLSVLIW